MWFFWSIVPLIMGHTVNLTRGGLLGLESSFRSKSKEAWWGGA